MNKFEKINWLINACIVINILCMAFCFSLMSQLLVIFDDYGIHESIYGELFIFVLSFISIFINLTLKRMIKKSSFY